MNTHQKYSQWFRRSSSAQALAAFPLAEPTSGQPHGRTEQQSILSVTKDKHSGKLASELVNEITQKCKPDPKNNL